MLEKNQEKINWAELSSNPNAIQLLQKNQDKINWGCLSSNPNAIHLLEENLDENLFSGYLSMNPNAMQLLEKNPDRIYWDWLSLNPSIFKKEINYKYLTERMNVIREELMMKCMHPSRLERFLEMGGEIDDF
jgi:hypothetical protein